MSEKIMATETMKEVAILNEFSDSIFKSNYKAGWWDNQDIESAKERDGLKYNKATSTLIASKLALVHSELSEALEGMRKGLMDDHLDHRPMLEVELADTMIRIFDLCGFLGLDIDGAVREKYAYNQHRSDHKPENRAKAGGKTI